MGRKPLVGFPKRARTSPEAGRRNHAEVSHMETAHPHGRRGLVLARHPAELKGVQRGKLRGRHKVVDTGEVGSGLGSP
eukprot:1533545-Pyramimonas_sp.AAC.1